MPSIRPEDLSPFGRAALKLAQEFEDLARVGEQMSRADVESDNGLDESIKILNRAASHGESLAAAMQELSATLQEARDKAETSAKFIAERAHLIQERRQKQEQFQDKLNHLKEEVRTAGAGLSGPSGKDVLTDEDKQKIAQELESMLAPLARFIEAAQKIKEEISQANFRRLERQADSIIDSLQATRRKIAQAIAPKQP